MPAAWFYVSKKLKRLANELSAISFSNHDIVMTLLYDQSLDILFTLQVFLYALSQLKI